MTAIYKPRPSYIVGIGASAGGLTPLVKFFEHLPDTTGMAFVVVQHLSPDFKSLMNELLAKHTALEIKIAEEGMVLEANTIYLNVPRVDLVLHNDCIKLQPWASEQVLHKPIDALFVSLAAQVRERAVAIVLSGSGSDGAQGVQAVHEVGGLVLAQDPNTAEFASMPLAAIQTKAVRHSLSPAQLAVDLHKLVSNTALFALSDDAELRESMGIIFDVLRKRYGIDFSQYKEATVIRRIERRMEGTNKDSLTTYYEFLSKSEDEQELLYQDILIGVTSFFRNPAVFSLLEFGVLPALVDSLNGEEPIRVWVPGCASGEEAYSLAMILMDIIGDYDRIQIFATDAHPGSLRKASAGIYPASSLENISPGRRERYFIEEGEGFRVVPSLRKTIIFAQHNVLSDAPFSSVHLLSCRNMLIYFHATAQEQVLQNFHFALKVNGILCLGKSESIISFKNEFEPVDSTQRIFRKTHYLSSARKTHEPLLRRGRQPTKRVPFNEARSPRSVNSRLLEAYDHMLREFAPPGLLLTAKRELLHSMGDARRYLQVPEGRPTTDALELIIPDLRLALSGTFSRSIQSGEPSSITASLFLEDGGRSTVEVRAKPFHDPGGEISSVLMTFVDQVRRVEASPEVYSILEQNGLVETRVLELERELHWTRETLQVTLEESEVVNEELQATNEELVASNEELQSTNEELQATNEELFTINSEYQKKNADLIALSSDLDHLFCTAAFGVVFLDANLCIRRFTEVSQRFFRITSQDEGRPLEHLATSLYQEDTVGDASFVLKTGERVEKQVRHMDGSIYLMTILPYRREQGPIEGVVMSFVDITPLTTIREALESSLNEFQLVLRESPVGLLFLTTDLVVKWVNPVTAHSFGKTVEELQDQPLLEVLPQQHAHMSMFNRVLEGEAVDSLGTELNGRVFDINYLPVNNDAGELQGILAVAKDITENVHKSREVRNLVHTLDSLPFGVLLFGWDNPSQPESPVELLYTNLIASGDGRVDAYGLLGEPITGEMPAVLAPLMDRRDLELVLTSHHARSWTRSSHDKIVEPWAYRCHAYPCGPGLVAVTYEDITEQNQTLEQQFRAQRMDAVTQLVGGLAHDLNNFLSIILLTCRIMESKLEPDNALRHEVDTLLTSSNRAADLLAQLMAFSKTRLAQPGALNIDEMVETSRPILARILGTEIELILDLHTPTHNVYIESSAMEQVLVNLVSNARKAQPDGGRVRIATSLVSEPVVQGRTRKGDFIKIDVSDKGRGMDDLTLRHCFEPFFSTRPKGQGTGLGLSMCLGVIEQADGIMTVDSAPDQGTTFYMYLPVFEVRPTVVHEGWSEDSDQDEEHGTILLVDDESSLRAALSFELGRLGYSILEASSAEEARAVASVESFDILVTDVIMPGDNGTALAKSLRAINPTLPVIFMSGFTEHAALRNSVWEDGDVLLVKPFDIEDLVDAVKSTFKKV